VSTLTLGKPVEDVLFMPAGGLLLAAAANTVYVYDILCGGRLLHQFTGHTKNVSVICLDGTNTRILTGGLGGHVKIHDVTTFQMVYGLKFKAPVVSLAVSPDNVKLVAGLVDGTLCIRTKKAASDEEENENDMRASMRTGLPSDANGNLQDEFRVERPKTPRLKQYEKSLRNFKYGRVKLNMHLTIVYECAGTRRR
jgi:U3 small nucleolar RNA-associated protein 15